MSKLTLGLSSKTSQLLMFFNFYFVNLVLGIPANLEPLMYFSCSRPSICLLIRTKQGQTIEVDRIIKHFVTTSPCRLRGEGGGGQVAQLLKPLSIK